MGREQNFRIIPSDSYGLYYIESKPLNKRVGLNDKNILILKDKYSLNPLKDTYWNITNLNNNSFLIQNNYTKNFITIKDRYKIILECKNNLTDITNGQTIQISNVPKNYKFSFFKLYEEVHLKPDDIPIIDNEPIDVMIKYIDLNDPFLNRPGIQKISKDEENQELKYCVRGILEYIPWVRKIFILMPNKRVRYFKPIEEISDKFVYVLDKDLLGFESEDVYTFHFHLWKMKKFNLSENFILMDDDYFIGKPINKSQFFYYDEEEKKVVPSVATDSINELNKDEVVKEYKKLLRRVNYNTHSFFGWKLQQLAAHKLLLDNFNPPLINGDFSHNAIPLNLNDLEEIYKFIEEKYPYANQTLFSTFRYKYGLQSQSLFNSYLLNVKKRKVNSIPYVYYDLGALKDKNLNIELFVINTSGDRKYTNEQKRIAKSLLENKFSKPTPYEIEFNKVQNTTPPVLKTTEYHESTIVKYEKLSNKTEEISIIKSEEISMVKYEKLNNNTEEIKTIIQSIKSQIKETVNETLAETEKKEDAIELNENKKSEIKKKNNLLPICYIIIFVIILLAFTYFTLFHKKRRIHNYQRIKIIKDNKKNEYGQTKDIANQKYGEEEFEKLANS